MSKRLYKSRKNKMIDGVCGGIAEYFNMDPTIVRIITVVIACFKGVGVLAYIIACFVIPYGESENVDDVENLKSANIDNDVKTESKTENASENKKHSDDEFNSYFDK